MRGRTNERRTWQPTHRHRRTGGLYRVVAYARQESDLSALVVYDNAQGDVWVRPQVEFDDGRFESLEVEASAGDEVASRGAANAVQPMLDLPVEAPESLVVHLWDLGLVAHKSDAREIYKTIVAHLRATATAQGAAVASGDRT